MSTTYPRSPLLVKGALIRLTDKLDQQVNEIIIFQYNPESMTRTLEVWNPVGGESASGNSTTGSYNASQTAQPHDPPETFNLVLELDAADDLEHPQGHRNAAASGVADRLAALEMLLYPSDDSLAVSLLRPLDAGANPVNSKIVPRGTVSVVLFSWGPGRIIPVRLTSFSVEEQAYSPTLYPIRAKVTIGMKVLSPKDFPRCHQTKSEGLAIAAFNHTRKERLNLAADKMANNAEIGSNPEVGSGNEFIQNSGNLA